MTPEGVAGPTRVHVTAVEAGSSVNAAVHRASRQPSIDPPAPAASGLPARRTLTPVAAGTSGRSRDAKRCDTNAPAAAWSASFAATPAGTLGDVSTTMARATREAHACF